MKLRLHKVIKRTFFSDLSLKEYFRTQQEYEWNRSFTEDKPCEGVSGPCESRKTRQAPCRTAYNDQSLNVSPQLCIDCAKEYNDYWDDMWNDYYSGIM